MTLKAWDAFVDPDIQQKDVTEDGEVLTKRRKNLSKLLGSNVGNEEVFGIGGTTIYTGVTEKGEQIKEERESRLTFEGHTGHITSFLFSHNRLYSASTDTTIRIWNPKRGNCLKVIKAHKDW
eukprot:CAMPEP_0174256924 /NCGR_PEP_ID=MMETSP0439-20130205/6124_1 /TAXON_ID=0 /ORGANISM="Stereomyxa ramosa, Strain Chinc5" /LENGTH=121 /DNA_ID=CAMNT_0015339775 /DNA_START=165 /DNA_END=527 /DNA_ORIENTATION=-